MLLYYCCALSWVVNGIKAMDENWNKVSRMQYEKYGIWKLKTEYGILKVSILGCSHPGGMSCLTRERVFFMCWYSGSIHKITFQESFGKRVMFGANILQNFFWNSFGNVFLWNSFEIFYKKNKKSIYKTKTFIKQTFLCTLLCSCWVATVLK